MPRCEKFFLSAVFATSVRHGRTIDLVPLLWVPKSSQGCLRASGAAKKGRGAKTEPQMVGHCFPRSSGKHPKGGASTWGPEAVPSVQFVGCCLQRSSRRRRKLSSAQR
mmetsp:Transcript_125996/g.403416  ORF Transcript_125996/g.403416 Transcript_125996/m.403416 type:complete len:108 (+) Transcript_125996:4998-5321(+)